MLARRAQGRLALLLALTLTGSAIAACHGSSETHHEYDASPGPGPGPQPPPAPTDTPLPPAPPDDGGPDGAPDAPAPNPDPPTPPKEGRVAIAVEPGASRAAKGTLLPLLVKATNADGTVEILKDTTGFTITLNADATGDVTTEYGGLYLRARSSGAVTVTVTDTASKLSGSATVQITDAVATALRVNLNRSVPKGLVQRAVAIATFDDESTQDVTLLATWEADPKDSVQAIDGAANVGAFRTLVEGTTTLVATFGNQTAKADFGIVAATVESLVIVPPTESIPLRTSTPLAVQAVLSDGEKGIVPNVNVKWKSSDENVLVVDEAGLVTAVGRGTATITADVRGFLATVAISVVDPVVQSVRLEWADDPKDQTFELKVSRTRRLALRGVRSDQSEVDVSDQAKWETSDAAIADVRNEGTKGLVIARAAGTATVKATFGNIAPVTVKVTTKN